MIAPALVSTKIHMSASPILHYQDSLSMRKQFVKNWQSWLSGIKA